MSFNIKTFLFAAGLAIASTAALAQAGGPDVPSNAKQEGAKVNGPSSTGSQGTSGQGTSTGAPSSPSRGTDTGGNAGGPASRN